MRPLVYLASGWFSYEQEKARQEILTAIIASDIDYYSPKEHGLFKPDEGDSLHSVFDENLIKIQDCDFVIASTVGKDMGTLFECGYAYDRQKPIVYYWQQKGPLNLMLAGSATLIIKTQTKLTNLLSDLVTNQQTLVMRKTQWEGEVE